jgi:aspartate/tyrosine/aromatic aminotransferase
MYASHPRNIALGAFMFESIPAKKGDSILALMTEYKNDPRTEKMDLGIGIYRNNEGETPIM